MKIFPIFIGKMKSILIYLDTHVVVWLYAGKIEIFSEKVKNLINKHELVVSPLVRLELQSLFEIQRITVKSNKIITDLTSVLGLKVCNKKFNDIINLASKLNWTRDPFDRIIVANAALNKNYLISKDRNILSNYKHSIW